MSDLSNTRLRGYEIQTVLGTGGFGVVYRAYQPIIDRVVAIKAIHPDYANNPEFVRRFEREAQFIARLEHLHIVPIYDYWRDPQGAFLVMRLLSGSVSATLYRDGPYALADAARLIEQIASALEIAHRSGIVHKDIKPENILLDGSRNGYLTDFGIAEDLTKSYDRDIEIYGSPAYISPEHALGQVVTPRSDIYSFGLLAYALLIGESPFQDQSITTMVNKSVNEPVPSVSAIRPGLAPEVDRVIWRATHKNPGERYLNPLSFAGDFRDALAVSEDRPFKKKTQPKVSTSAVTNNNGGTLPLDEALSGEMASTLNLSGETADAQQHTYSTVDLVTGPVTTNPIPVIPQARNPFKGLRAFDESDASDFFGRETLVKQLLARLEEDAVRFLALVGASGSGKSSVVKAGLLPDLRRGHVTGSERWFITTMVPGAEPLLDLEQAILRVAFDLPETPLADQFQQDAASLHQAVLALLPEDDPDTELLLFIDQFEEVFILADADERQQFIDNIVHAVTTTDSRLRVIITLRADFYDRPLGLPGIGDLMRRYTEVVLPLSPAELETAIVQPALNANLIVEKDLIATMVADVHNQPGALPLLQFALTELFERREGFRLSQQSYEAIGRVSGALAQRAEDLFQYLDEAQQEIVRRIFLRLVALGVDGADDTRQRALRSDLLTLGDDLGGRDSIEQVINVFGRYRLLTFDKDPATRAPTVEIAHEALIRHWQRLRDWLDAGRDSLRTQQRLTLVTTEWENNGRDESYLARGSRLVQFEDLAQAAAVPLNAAERHYIQASIALRQRAANRLKLFAAVLAGVALIAIALAVLALDRQNDALNAEATALAERDRANEQAQIARSRELALAAIGDRNRYDTQLLISLQALDTYDTTEARRSLLNRISANPSVETFLHDDAALRAVAINPDGTLIATAGDGRTIQLWDARTNTPIGTPLTGHDAAIWDIAFSPDGAWLASAGADGAVLLWAVAEGEVVGGPVRLRQHESAVYSLAFSPDGARLASAGADGNIILWSLDDTVSSDADFERLSAHEDTVFALAFNPQDSTMLASGGADQTIRLWNLNVRNDLDEPQLTVLRGHENWVLTLDFHPTGRFLASSGPENQVFLWDVEAAEFIASQQVGHQDWIRRVAFSPDGILLATASADNIVRLWDVSIGQPAGVFTAHADVVWDVVFTPDGTQLVSASSDHSVILWNIEARSRLAASLSSAAQPTHSEAVLSVAFSPDDRLLASAGGGFTANAEDFAIRLWDTETGDILQTYDGHRGGVTALAFHPQEPLLVSGSADWTLLLWDTAEREAQPRPLDTLLAHESGITGAAFSPDGRYLASSDDTGMLILWAQDAEGVWQIAWQQEQASITQLAFSPDGRTLAVGDAQNTITLWDVVTSEARTQEARTQEARTLEGHTDVVTALAFTADSAVLASGGRDNVVRLWDVASGEGIGQPLTYHVDWIGALAIHGDMLASGSRDNTIMLWDIRDPSRPQTLGVPLMEHTDWVSALDFSRDGALLASGGRDRQVILWQTSLSTWQDVACTIANRSLTPDEWTSMMGIIPYKPACIERS